MSRSSLTPLIVVLVAGLAAGASAQPSKPAPLLPLHDDDAYKFKDSGCAFSFERADRKTMFDSIENTMMVRTKSGLTMCKIPAATFDAFRDAKGAVTCGGQRLGLRKTGKQVEPREGTEDDGSSYPAVLTIGSGPTAVTVKGDASTAC